MGARLTALSQLCFKDKFRAILKDHGELEFGVTDELLRPIGLGGLDDSGKNQ